jgi:hypothetical protein
MKAYINFLVSIIKGIIRRYWYHFKSSQLRKEIKSEKNKLEHVEKESTNAVDDFKSYYDEYKSSKSDKTEL